MQLLTDEQVFGKLPIGIRNNNPGNIRASANSFKTFDTPEEGISATAKNLIAYNDKHGLNTINGIINRWAPPSDNNDTGSYIDSVSKDLGVAPNQPLNVKDHATLSKLVTAITKHENGMQPYDEGLINKAVGNALSYKVASNEPVAPPSGQKLLSDEEVFGKENLLTDEQVFETKPKAKPVAVNKAYDVPKSIAQGLREGITAPLELGMAAGNAIGNFNTMIGNKVGGLINPLGHVDMPYSETPNVSAMLDAVGLNYEPKTTGGKFARTISSFVPLSATGGTLPEIAGNVVKYGVLPGAASEAAGQATKGTEAEPYARITAALVTAGLSGPILDMAVQKVGDLWQKTGKPIEEFLKSFTQEGRESAVGNLIRERTVNPQMAANRLQQAKEIVPGSYPTAAEASGDYGIATIQKYAKNVAPEKFAERLSQQNAARNILLENMAGNEAQVNAMKEARDATTAPLREFAFKDASPLTGKQSNQIMQNLDDVLASPAGARESVKQAVQWVKKNLNGETNPQRLYEIRKDINDAMQGKYSGELSSLKLAKSELKDIKSFLDDAIDAAAPGFKNYLEEYASQSKPITQMETMQDIGKRTQLAGQDATTGYDFISQPKWKNVVKANRNELKKVLTSTQLSNLDRITADLDRGASINSHAIRSMGSDTFSNQSVGMAIGAALKKSGVPFLDKAFSWAHDLGQQKTQQLLVEAMLDPKLAAQLMMKATPKTIEAVSFNLKNYAEKLGLSATSALPSLERRKQIPRIEIRPENRSNK